MFQLFDVPPAFSVSVRRAALPTVRSGAEISPSPETFPVSATVAGQRAAGYRPPLSSASVHSGLIGRFFGP